MRPTHKLICTIDDKRDLSRIGNRADCEKTLQEFIDILKRCFVSVVVTENGAIATWENGLIATFTIEKVTE